MWSELTERRLHDLTRHLAECRVAGATPILHIHFHPAGIADAAHRRRGEHHDLRLLDRAELGLHLGQEHANRAAAGGAGAGVFQSREAGRGIGGVGPRRSGEAGERHGIFHAVDGKGCLADPSHDGVGARKRCAVGQLGGHDEVALVLLGDEAGGHQIEAGFRGDEQPGIEQEHQEAHPNKPPDDRAVEITRPGEDAIEGDKQPAKGQVHQPGDEAPRRISRLEEQAAEGRRERE